MTPRLFALSASRGLGERVAASLGWPLAPHEERAFEDGEHKTRPLVPVRGADAFVLHSLHGTIETSPNDELCRLLFFVGALVDAGAARVTAVCPYLCYARKERKTKPRDPVTTRYVAGLFEAVGTHRVVTVDVHDVAAFQNAFRCLTEHLETRFVLARRLALELDGREAVVVSPDAGGFKRAERFRRALAEVSGAEVSIAFLQKERSEGRVWGDAVVGEVAGRVAVIVDDLIATGTTLRRAAAACRARGAHRVFAAATHGLFVGGASDLLAEPALDHVFVCDTVRPFRVDATRAEGRLTVVDLAPLLASAVQRLHTDGSLVDLVERGT